MGAVATLDPAAFTAAHPAFASLTPAQIGTAFTLAPLYLANDGSGPVADVATQTTLLYLLTAHIAQLTFGINGQPPSGLVGRLSSASEGSVSVSTDLAGLPSGAAWFAQTQFGLLFWQATARFRMARYTPGPSRFGYGGLPGFGYGAGLLPPPATGT